MNRTDVFRSTAAAAAVFVLAAGCGDASGRRSTPSGPEPAPAAGTEFRAESMKIKGWKVCETFDLDEIAEYMDYQEYGKQGKLEGGYVPGQITSHYGRCHAFVTYGSYTDSRGRATETGGRIMVGLYPSDSEEEAEASYREYQDLFVTSIDDDVEVVDEREMPGDWDEGRLLVTEDGFGATRINLLVRDRGFVLEADVEYDEDKGLEHARKKGLDVAGSRHLPFDDRSDLVEWLQNTYLPEAHAKVVTGLAAS